MEAKHHFCGSTAARQALSFCNIIIALLLIVMSIWLQMIVEKINESTEYQGF
jgi:hypothetical protein